VPAAKLHADAVLFGDTLLKADVVKRNVASERIRVTSLGKPVQDTVYTDRWQRRWQLRTWDIPFANSIFFTLALPVPDGYVAIGRVAPRIFEHEYESDLKAMADFVGVAYHGRLSEWKDFLRDGAAVPAALSSIKIDFDDSKQFRYQSRRVRFTVPNDVQPIAPDNLLVLGFNIIGVDGKFVWDVGDIRLNRNANEPDRINVQRQVAPRDDMDDTFKHNWAKLIQRQHPYDGETRTENDETRITAVVGDDKSPSVAYTVFIALPSSKNAADLKVKLARLMSSVNVDDR
jgi:serine protease Do